MDTSTTIQLKRAILRIYENLARQMNASTTSAISGHKDIPEVDLQLGPNLPHGSLPPRVWFFAAYHYATRDPEARKMALQTLAPLVPSGASQKSPAHKALSNTLWSSGGWAGTGLLLYGVLRLAEWLDSPELLDLAQQWCSTITPQRMVLGNRLDLLCGWAGTLLGVLSLMQEGPAFGLNCDAAIDGALACGDALLENRVMHTSGFHAWPVHDGVSPCGFAYGASGISYALARLFQCTWEERFRAAAMEGFAFERALYDSSRARWAPGSFLEKRGSLETGSAGIALGRLGSLAIMETPVLRDDLEIALNVTRSLPESALDDLLAGNYGRVEVLHTAGQLLHRSQLSDQALDLNGRLLYRAESRGFALSRSNDPSSISFLRGLAGIGYTLLRLLYPGLLPSLLLLETTAAGA